MDASMGWVDLCKLIDWCFEKILVWCRQLVAFCCIYIKRHLLLLDRFRIGFCGNITHLTDSSNKFLRPRCVSAEHSRYLTALILLAIFMPCSRFTGLWPICASCESVSRSSRRSVLVPTRIMGTSLQWCRISGAHLTSTFSSFGDKSQVTKL